MDRGSATPRNGSGVTDKKQLKARIRARMAKTGESYTAARRHLVGGDEVPRDGAWTFQGGRHPYTSVVARLTGVAEPLVFLAGGGIGAGYILWEFKHHDAAVLTLGFRNTWQYHDRWLDRTLERLNVSYDTEQTGGAKGAARRLAQELDAGRPCVVVPDQQRIGYWRLPGFLDGHGGHPVIVYGRAGGALKVDDRGRVPILVPEERMQEARGRVSSYKNALWVIGEAKPDLASAVREGLRDCHLHLTQKSDSFSLPAWRKWARTMTDAKHAKGWPRVFADGRGLAGALLSIWEGVEPVGIDGGNLRDLFADGLSQAAGLLGEERLTELAAEFTRIHGMWHGLAEAAVPAEVYGRARELTAAIRQAVAEEGEAGQAEAAELWELRARLDAEPARADFADLGARLLAIHEAETAAIARLGTIV